MKKFALLIATVIFFLGASNALAQYGPYEGPGPSDDVIIDKLVGVPTASGSKGENITYEYTDNLGGADFTYSPTQYIFFKLKIKNISGKTLENLVVKDFAPEYVELYNDPGTYNGDNRTLTINLGKLEPNEEKEYIIQGRVYSKDKFPTNQNLFCVVNKGRVENPDTVDEDTSQFCIKREGIPTTGKVPAAGPELAIVYLAGAGVMGKLGLKLRKIK